MKKTMRIMLILLFSATLFGCTTGPIPEQGNNVQRQKDMLDKQAVAGVVDSFGKNLQRVSLLAPADMVNQSMQDNYSSLVSPMLLAKWQEDPQNSPGRMVSSPWPDRIEILSNEKLADGTYEVKGEIIEITSEEQTKGGVAAKRPITLALTKFDDQWLISGVRLGAYPAASSILYINNQFGFTFTLPQSWQNYSVITTRWEGIAIEGELSGQVIQTGPIIRLRSPQWTVAIPRQDIPIMVFTVNQWNGIQKEEFSVGAAPIPPSELGRNSRYVLALPARYNYAFPVGFEEVETILNGKPMQPTEVFDK